MTEQLRSKIYHGRVRHRRTKPSAHHFEYPVYQTLLDLDEIPEIEKRIPFFGYNRQSLTSFFDSDYMGKAEEPVKEKLVRWLERQGLRASGPVLLLTSLRVLGYGFNPVSYYYVLDARGSLDFAVAEINNTFGESYAYILDRKDNEQRIDVSFPKVFHISPFISMKNISYRFRLTAPGHVLSVHIDEFENGEKFFDATLSLRESELNPANMARALVTGVHLPLKVISWIHWQALKLWIAKFPVFAKPEPPHGVLSRSQP